VPRRHLSAFCRGGAFVGLLALCGLACSGSSSLNSVKGKVLYKNQPLAGALVVFHPKGGSNDMKAERPTGLTKDDGTFTLTTGQKDGAAAGEYKVTIFCTAPLNKKAGKQISLGADEETADVLGGAYANVDNSKITVTVKSGTNELEPFDLK
jgi:hypothetical protein